MLTSISFGFIALTIAGFLLFNQIWAKKIFWLFGIYGLFVVGEIVSAIGYGKALVRHKRAGEDLDLACKDVCKPARDTSLPQD